jgi:hypothetical protein
MLSVFPWHDDGKLSFITCLCQEAETTLFPDRLSQFLDQLGSDYTTSGRMQDQIYLQNLIKHLFSKNRDIDRNSFITLVCFGEVHN